MVELLKQPQYNPYSVEEQVVSILAGTKGYLDELPEAQVAAFEVAMLKHFRREHPEVLAEVREKQAISDELGETIGKIVTNFKGHYLKGREQ